MFRFRADHEPRNILHEEQRGPVTITSVDEVSDLLSRFRVNDPTELWRPARGIAKHAARIRNHAYLKAVDTRMAGDDFFRVVGLKLIEMSIVEKAIEQRAHVVGLAVIFRKDRVDVVR